MRGGLIKLAAILFPVVFFTCQKQKDKVEPRCRFINAVTAESLLLFSIYLFGLWFTCHHQTVSVWVFPLGTTEAFVSKYIFYLQLAFLGNVIKMLIERKATLGAAATGTSWHAGSRNVAWAQRPVSQVEWRRKKTNVGV